MTHESALALFSVMQPERRAAVLRVFDGIKGTFPDIRDAFTQAVTDEAYVIETEMLLLQRVGMMQ